MTDGTQGASGAAVRRRRRCAGPRRWIVALALATTPAPLVADTILLTFHSVPGGLGVSGAGTNIGIVDFGNVSAFGPLNAGVSRTTGALDYTISTQFGVRVVRVLGTTTSYTLRARLLAVNPLTWRVNGVPLSTAQGTVATLQPYGAILPHTLSFVVPYGSATGGVNAQLEVMAIVN